MVPFDRRIYGAPSTNELAQALSLQEAKLQTVTAGHGGITQDFFNGQSRVIHGTLWKINENHHF